MKIGMVLYPTYGGSGVVATELGKELAKQGHEIHFITYNHPVRLGALRQNIFYHEVRVSDYPLFTHQPYELVLSSKLVHVVKLHQLDLLHVHYAIPHASAAYMAQQILKSEGIEIPYITTLHGTDITLVGKDASFEPVITFAINRSNAVTTVSESLKADTLSEFDVTNDIEVIPNFIEPDSYQLDKNNIYKERYAPNGEKLISHISNFRPVKRVEDVVKIFHGIRQVIPSRLLLVGDGPDRTKAEQMCRQLGFCEDVLFLGNLKSTKEVLNISDLFLLPSETESFGLAALEALASGVPVVASDTGGIPEVNQDGFSGYNSVVGDVEMMIENSLKVLSDPIKYSENAKIQASKFDISKILPKYLTLYKGLLK